MSERLVSDIRPPMEGCVEDLYRQFRQHGEGEVASYIPELSKVDPDLFGISIATADGKIYSVGDCDVPFTIQSISKAFVFGLALMDHGFDAVLEKVGVEPSGEAFNSIIFDEKGNRPFNPMVNAGAIATAAMVKGTGIDERWGRLLAFLEGFAGHSLTIDRAVYLSEQATGHRNRAIGHLELNFGMIDDRVEEHLDLYFQQCSILVTSRDLAVMAATLANNGVNPLTGLRAIDQKFVKNVIAVMSSCGMYDYSGEWLYRVGIPAKSGVGGGIIAVLPGQLGVGTFSPPLDDRGNSVRGIKVCERLSHQFGLHMFDVPNMVNSAVARQYSGDRIGSKRLRNPWEQQVLRDEGSNIVVYELRGDLIFSSVEPLLRRIDESTFVRHVVLDCKRVGNINAPAAQLIVEAIRAQQAEGGTLVVAGLAPESSQRQILIQAGLEPGNLAHNLDRALELAEEAVLNARADRPASDSLARLSEIEMLAGLSETDLEVVQAATETESYSAGAVVFTQGSQADRLYFLARGQAGVYLTSPQGPGLRLAAISAGICFGEMALLDGKPRSAELRADTDILCHTLSIKRLDQLGIEHPKILNTILANLARILSNRLRQANQEIATLEV